MTSIGRYFVVSLSITLTIDWFFDNRISGYETEAIFKLNSNSTLHSSWPFIKEPRQILLEIIIKNFGPKRGFFDHYFENKLRVLLHFASVARCIFRVKTFPRRKIRSIVYRCTLQDGRQVFFTKLKTRSQTKTHFCNKMENVLGDHLNQ